MEILATFKAKHKLKDIIKEPESAFISESTSLNAIGTIRAGQAAT
jgi:hypothetical protein